MAFTSLQPFWALWGLPLAFLVHDGEEAIYLAARGYGVTALFTGAQTTVAESLAAMGVELTLIVVVTWLAWRQTNRRPTATARSGATYVFAVLLAAWTMHGLIHLGGAAFAGGYAMGAITAIPACLGYGGWALSQLYRLGLVGRTWLAAAPVLGIVAFVPLLGIAHELGRLLG